MVYTPKYCPNCEAVARVGMIVSRPYHTCPSCKTTNPVENLITKSSRATIGGPAVSFAPLITQVGSGTYVDGSSSTATVDSSQFALNDNEQIIAVVWSRDGSGADPTSVKLNGGTYGLNLLGWQTSVVSGVRLMIYASDTTTSFGTLGTDYFNTASNYLRVTWGATYPTCGGIQVFKLDKKVSTDKTTSSTGTGFSASTTTDPLGYFDDIIISAIASQGLKGSTTNANWDSSVLSFAPVSPATGGTYAANCSVAYKRVVGKDPQTTSATLPSAITYTMVTIAFRSNVQQ